MFVRNQTAGNRQKIQPPIYLSDMCNMDSLYEYSMYVHISGVL